MAQRAAPNSEANAKPRSWVHVLADYRKPDSVRGLLEILVTAVPFALLWWVMWMAVDAGYWIGLLLAVPAAGFLVRLFLIQHDCGHGSFFPSRRVNDWVGRVIGVLTLTPYAFWRRTHTHHHANSGNLDRPDIGEINTLTVGEYQALSRIQRLRYRLYRHPIVLFGIGPAYVFLLRNRLPVGFMRVGWKPWLSTMGTNAAVATLITALVAWLGLVPFLLVHAPIIILASSLGVWLFYVQHQFEGTYWRHTEDWRFRDAALHGSSHYDLPAVLRWLTANIGVHHVHHLCSRIPSYRLHEVLRDHPELRGVGRITLWQSLACVRLTLWDEQARRLVSFPQARMELLQSGQVAAHA